MVGAVLRFVSKEIQGLHVAAALLGGFTFLSQILAVFRDRLLAHFFGAGATLDMYYAAFRVPDFVFVAIASIVSISVLVPFFSRFSDKLEEKEFIDSIFSFFFLLIVVVCGTLFFIMPFIIPLVFPGFEASQSEVITTLSRYLLLSPILLGLSNFFASIVQAHRRFFIYGISPVLYNIGIILGIVFLVPIYGVIGVVYGVLFGAFMHLIIQFSYVLKTGLFPRITLPLKKYVIPVVLHSLPRTLAMNANQLVLLILISMASLLAVGSISVFNLSFNLQSAPLALIGVSYSLAAFPTLSKLFSEGRTSEFIERCSTAIRHVIFWSIPITITVIVLRAHIVRIILGTGEFGWRDTRLTAAALALFSVSLVFQGLNLLFMRAFYATGNTKKPVIFSLISSFSIIFLASIGLYIYENIPQASFIFKNVLRVDYVFGGEVLILPLAYTIGMALQAIFLGTSFVRIQGLNSKTISESTRQVFLASILMGISMYGVLALTGGFFALTTFSSVLNQALVSGILGLVVMMLTLYLLHNKELLEIFNLLKARIKRRGV